MKVPERTPEPFEAGNDTVPFERAIADLSGFKFVVLDAAIRRVLAEQARTQPERERDGCTATSRDPKLRGAFRRRRRFIHKEVSLHRFRAEAR